MSKTLTPIPFFVDEIALCPHTATRGEWLGQRVTLRTFAARFNIAVGLRLSQVEETGELLAEIGKPGTPCYEFMEGPEALS